MSATDAGDAQRWDEQVGMLAHRVAHTDGSLLALLVGQDGTSVEVFAADLGAALPEGHEVRRLQIDEAHLNPFADIQDVAAIERVFFLAHGLGTLTPEQRKNALRLMNWSRAQLSRRTIQLGLWVETDLLRDLYTYAGDFVDWWQVLLELPEAPERQNAPGKPGVGVWERFQELLRLYDEEARQNRVGLNGDTARILELERFVRAAVQPGQIIAGVRLVAELETNLWRGVALDSNEPRLVHVLSLVRRYDATRFQHEHQLFVRRSQIRELDGKVVELLKSDERILAYVTTMPGGESIGAMYINRPIEGELDAQTFVRTLEIAAALIRQDLLLVALRVQDIRLDEGGRPLLTRLFGVVPVDSGLKPTDVWHDNPRGGLPVDAVVRADQSSVVFCMGQLLKFMLAGQYGSQFDISETTAAIRNPVTVRLAEVASDATWHNTQERIQTIVDLTAATDGALRGATLGTLARLASPTFKRHVIREFVRRANSLGWTVPWMFVVAALTYLAAEFVFEPRLEARRHDEQELREELVRLRAQQEELLKETQELKDQIDAIERRSDQLLSPPAERDQRSP